MKKQTHATALGIALLAVLPEGKITDSEEGPAFTKAADFTVVLPEQYDHTTVLAEFTKEFTSTSFRVNPNITDDAFAGVTQAMMAGKKYRVRVYRHAGVTTEEAFAFLSEKGALLVGAQGLAAVARLRGHELIFKTKEAVISFGEERGLPVIAGEKVVPAMTRQGFGLAPFSQTWPQSCNILCITRIVS